MEGYHLTTYTALSDRTRLDLVPIDPQVTAIQWGTILPGGFAGLQVGMSPQDSAGGRGYLTRPVEVRDFSHIELRRGAALLWAGRVTQLDLVGAELLTITGAGYGTEALIDGVWTSTDTSASTTGALLRAVLAATCPLLAVGDVDQFLDPGVAHTGVEFTGRTPADILNQLLQEGTTNGQLYDWWVYENQVANLRPRDLGADQPRWYCPLDHKVARTKVSRDTYGAVTIKYRTAAGTDSTTSATVPNFVDRYGLSRATIVDGGQLEDAAAAAFAATYAQLHGIPAESIVITYTEDDSAESYSGARLPPYLIRAGHWMRVGDLNPKIVIRTTGDTSQGSYVVELGDPSPSYAQYFSALLRSAAHVARNTSPVSGAPR